MTTEQKFCAAVDVVNSLPTNGPFQPSQDLMLKFYSYQKQATEGPCNAPKPSFWDANKHKWAAWKSLGKMPKETAMNKYVEELVKIIETMAYNETVSIFMDVMGPIYEIVWQDDEDIQHLDSNKHKTSGGSSQINDATGSRQSGFSENIIKENTNLADNCSAEVRNFHLKCPNQTEDSKKIGNIEFRHSEKIQNNTALFENQSTKNVDFFIKRNYSSMKKNSKDMTDDSAFQFCRNVAVSNTPHVFVNNMLSSSVIHLQKSLEEVIRHLDALEILIKSYKMQNLKIACDTSKSSSWGLPPWATAFAFLWPFFVHWLLYILRKQKKKIQGK